MVLSSVSDNIPKTPGRAVKYLRNELEKKDAENESLHAQIADLSKALGAVKLVQDSAPAIPDKKTKKDPNAPKPAVTAYKFFCEDIKSTKAGADKPAKELQLMWKDCKEDKRANYVEKAAADKKRFEAENAEYQALQKLYQQREQDAAMALLQAQRVAAVAATNDDAAKKKKRTKKDPDAPKRAKSAYLFFCDAVRADITKANAGKAPTEITKILGEEWNKLEKGKGGKNGTKKYDGMAAKDKSRYEAEKVEYDAKKAEEQAKIDEEKESQLALDREEARKMVEVAQTEEAAKQAAIDKQIKKEVKKVSASKKEEKPKGPKRAASAYNFFLSENREKIKAKMPEGATFAEISAEVGKQWKALSATKKKPYEKKANTDKERYQKEVEAMNA